MRTIDVGRVSYRAWDGGTRRRPVRERRERRDERRDRAARERDDEGARREGVVPAGRRFAVFSGWQTTEIEVAVDGERRTGRMFDVVVANGRYLGGGLEICPEAEPDDGLFDVLTIGDVTKRDLVLDHAEDVPGHTPAAPEGGASARPRP